MQPALRILATFGIAVSLFLSACDAWTTAQGTVRDTRGRPVYDALVTLKIGDDSRTFRSLPDGRFLVHMWQPPFKLDVTLTVAKSGYLLFEKHFKGPGVFRDFDVVLKAPHEEPLDSAENIVKAMFPFAPENSHDVNCFRSLTSMMSVDQVAQKCGRPDADLGSGIYIFVWSMPGGSSVSIGTATLKRVGNVRYYDASSGKTTLLVTEK